MKDSVEEHIYNTLVIRKKSIKSINDLNPWEQEDTHGRIWIREYDEIRV
jgi:hypothetical protein